MSGYTRRAVSWGMLFSGLGPAVAGRGLAPIRVGAILSLPGSCASLGDPQLNTLALLPGNVAGLPLDVRIVDDASDAGTAVDAARQMMGQDGVDILFGTTVTPTTLLLIPIAAATATLSSTSPPAAP